MKSNMKDNVEIGAVLFDFGGVIAEEGFKLGLAAIARANKKDVEAVIQGAFDATYATGYVLGKGTEEAFWDEMRKKTGIKGDDADLRAEIMSRFIVRDWMIHLVGMLKEKDLIVGILSDQTDYLDRLNERYDFYEAFDHVFNSYGLGKGKRDAALFDDIAAILKVEAGRILFIDDDPSHVARARQKGWQAIHYRDRESFQRDLKDVLPFLKRAMCHPPCWSVK